jgi:hypothetical protein
MRTTFLDAGWLLRDIPEKVLSDYYRKLELQIYLRLRKKPLSPITLGLNQ